MKRAPALQALPGEREAGALSRNLRDVLDHRDLAFTLLSREIRVRYKQALLGVAWAVLQPFALMLLFTLVFNRVLGVESGEIPYPYFSFAGLLCWLFVANGLTFASTSLVGNPVLVTKIYVPRELLTVAAVGASAFDFLLALLLFIVLLSVAYQPPSLALLWVLPVFVVHLALVLGASLFLAAVNVSYRDIRFVVPLGLQLWMFASPIIYSIAEIPERYRLLYQLNPVAGIIESYRRVVLELQPPQPGQFLGAALLAMAILWGGYLYFKRAEWRFADVI